MFSMHPPMLGFLHASAHALLFYSIMFRILLVKLFEILGNSSISTNFNVTSMDNYQDKRQISMYVSFIRDKLILLAPAITQLKMMSAAYIRDMHQTPF